MYFACFFLNYVHLCLKMVVWTEIYSVVVHCWIQRIVDFDGKFKLLLVCPIVIFISNRMFIRHTWSTMYCPWSCPQYLLCRILNGSHRGPWTVCRGEKYFRIPVLMWHCIFCYWFPAFRRIPVPSSSRVVWSLWVVECSVTRLSKPQNSHRKILSPVVCSFQPIAWSLTEWAIPPNAGHCYCSEIEQFAMGWTCRSCEKQRILIPRTWYNTLEYVWDNFTMVLRLRTGSRPPLVVSVGHACWRI
jgi:hypothetical protein